METNYSTPYFIIISIFTVLTSALLVVTYSDPTIAGASIAPINDVDTPVVQVLKEIRNELQETNIRLDRMCEAQEKIAATFGAVEVYNEKGGLVSQER